MDVVIEPRCDVCGVKPTTLLTCPGCRLYRVCQEHDTEAMRQAHQPLCEAVVDAWNDVLDTDFRARQATCQEYPGFWGMPQVSLFGVSFFRVEHDTANMVGASVDAVLSYVDILRSLDCPLANARASGEMMQLWQRHSLLLPDFETLASAVYERPDGESVAHRYIIASELSVWYHTDNSSWEPFAPMAREYRARAFSDTHKALWRELRRNMGMPMYRLGMSDKAPKITYPTYRASIPEPYASPPSCDHVPDLSDTIDFLAELPPDIFWEPLIPLGPFNKALAPLESLFLQLLHKVRCIVGHSTLEAISEVLPLPMEMILEVQKHAAGGLLIDCPAVMESVRRGHDLTPHKDKLSQQADLLFKSLTKGTQRDGLFWESLLIPTLRSLAWREHKGYEDRQRRTMEKAISGSPGFKDWMITKLAEKEPLFRRAQSDPKAAARIGRRAYKDAELEDLQGMASPTGFLHASEEVGTHPGGAPRRFYQFRRASMPDEYPAVMHHGAGFQGRRRNSFHSAGSSGKSGRKLGFLRQTMSEVEPPLVWDDGDYEPWTPEEEKKWAILRLEWLRNLLQNGPNFTQSWEASDSWSTGDEDEGDVEDWDWEGGENGDWDEDAAELGDEIGDEAGDEAGDDEPSTSGED